MGNKLHWWRVQWNTPSIINKVKVWCRQDIECLEHQISDFAIETSSDGEHWTEQAYSPGPAGNPSEFIIDHVQARHVRIIQRSVSDYLVLGEVEVWGYKPN